ncbi:CRISPR-associated endonuclease Cas3'' [Candidatus Desantisbacteria bacterium]|nr:CRISPR-associated endonuclease Cas3'' [Candidatus Desantisbacteria bacterium]
MLAHSAKKDIPAQPYEEHILNVYNSAITNAEKAGVHTKYRELLLASVKYAAFFHDLGKLAPENQRILERRNCKGSLPINHVDCGVAALQSGNLSIAENLAALFVYSHHIGLPSLPEENAKGKGNIFRDITIKELMNQSLNKYMEDNKSLLNFFPDIKESQSKEITPTQLFMRIGLSCLVDADHTDTARNYNGVVPSGEILLQADERLSLLDNFVKGLTSGDPSKIERDNLRQEIYEACRNAPISDKGIITCDSPVGTGKTTAVMAHLLNIAKIKKLRRIFVVLPFTNIIEQSVDIYRKALILPDENPEKVIAAHHHKAEFEDESTRVFSFLWNAPVTVTTAVQFFETLATNRTSSLRKLHQLAGSAIFIDETHATLPASLWAQAWKWLKELVDDWGCYIVLASGSLNRFWELEEFSNPPSKNIPELVTDVIRNKAIKGESVRVKYLKKEKSLNMDELCNWIKNMDGPRLLILNTVHSAAAVAKRLCELHGDRKYVEHISTALAPIHRKKIIDRIKQRLLNRNDKDWTLVATSCVEAGVDFSFNTAAREFCSLTSTLQTAGRINRSGEYGISNLWGFQISLGGFLREHPTFLTSSKVLKQMYDEGKIFSEFCTEAMKREVREKNQTSADNNSIVIAERNKEFPSVKEQFKIIPSNTVTTIIDKDLKERIERHEKIDFMELQQKSVAIYSNRIDLYALEPLHGFNDLYLWLLDYDEDFLGYMAGVLKLDNTPENFII